MTVDTYTILDYSTLLSPLSQSIVCPGVTDKCKSEVNTKVDIGNKQISLVNHSAC